MPKPHIYVGDFNYRMGPLNNDTSIVKAPRQYLITEFCTRWQFPWRKPHYENRSSRSSRTDHCFMSSFFDANIKVLMHNDPCLRSDHYPLHIEATFHPDEIGSLQHECSTTANVQRRIYIRRLQNDPKKSTQYMKRIESKVKAVELQSRMDMFFASCLSESFTRRQLRAALDNFNDEITYLIWDSGSEVAGSYEVNRAKNSTDNLMFQLNESESNTEATMTFKRLNRGKHVRVQSSTSSSEVNADVNAEARDFFSNLWNDTKPDELVGLMNSDAPFLCDDYPLTPLDMDAAVEPFSMQAIKTTIAKYPSSKSAGVDSIHVLLLKPLTSSFVFMQALYSLYSMCLQFGLTPTGWNFGRTTLIAKKQQDPTVQSTRPISVTSMLRRIFECCLLKSWEFNAEAFIKLHPNQGGSRRGYSSFSYAVVNHELSHLERDWTALLDIKKGFDSVRHVDLLRTLLEKKTPKRPMSLIHSLFMDQMHTQLIVNGRASKPIKVSKGIFQGSVLSPLLFELWIDELCELLDAMKPDDNLPVALFYVDDVVLKTHLRRLMQDLLDICETWMTSRGAKFNVEKCYLLNPKPELLPQIESSPLLLYDKPIIVTQEEEYLGVPTSSRGARWNKLLMKQFQEAVKVFHFFKAVGDGWPEWVRLILVKTFCYSKFNYCSPCTKLWLELHNDTREAATFREMLNGLDEEILYFIFQTTLPQSSNVMRDMIQLDKTWFHIGEQRDMVIEQVQRLSKEHPWHVLKQRFGTSSVMRNDYYLPRLHHSSESVREYHRLNPTAAERQRVSLKAFFKITKYYRLHYETDGRLHHMILAKARKTLHSPDKIIFIKDFVQRKMCIDWRRNLLFNRRKCAACSEIFNRRHLIDCDYQLLVPDSLYNESIHRTWLDECDFLAEDDAIHDWSKGARIIYTVIDSLLNNAAFDLAYQWLSWLSDNLPTTSPPPQDSTPILPLLP